MTIPMCFRVVNNDNGLRYDNGIRLDLHDASTAIGDGPFGADISIGVDYTVFEPGPGPGPNNHGRIMCDRGDCIPCHPKATDPTGCTAPPPPPRIPRRNQGEELVLSFPIAGAIAPNNIAGELVAGRVLVFPNKTAAQATLKGMLRSKTFPERTQFHVFDVIRVPASLSSSYSGLVGKVIAIPVTVTAPP
jgi:hypothetical protein